MDRDMHEMLVTSLRRVLTEDSARSLSDRLAELGWDDVLADDAPSAVRALFDVKGATLSAANALGPRLAAMLADETGAENLSNAAVVLPTSLHPSALSSRIDGDELQVTGVALAEPEPDAPVVVPVDDHDRGIRLAILERGDQVGTRPIEGIDPDLHLVQIDTGVPVATATWCEGDAAAAAWDSAVAHGRWALAAELLGIGRHVIEHAVTYAGERVQYGRAIGTFQAVQHRLASAHASVVGASSVVTEAAESGSAWVATVAKALAGRAAEGACTQAQQVYGAIGFTWEHEFHRYLRRAYVLDRLLGDWRTLEQEIGTQLQSTRVVPRIGVL